MAIATSCLIPLFINEATGLSATNQILIQQHCAQRIEVVELDNPSRITTNNDIRSQRRCASLLEAAEKGLAEQVQQFLKQKVDVDQVDDRNSKALLYASYKGHTQIVKLLLQAMPV